MKNNSIKEITSPDNPLIKQIQKLQQKKYRQQTGLFLLEGCRLIETALQNQLSIETMVFSTDYQGVHYPAPNCIAVPHKLFCKLCDTEHPQGVLAVARQFIRTNPPDGELLVLCDRIADPGNLGTIIRSADALGFDGVVLSPGCADVYSPKVIRSTMGSFCSVPLYQPTELSNCITHLQTHGYTLLVSALTPDAQSLYRFRVNGKTLLVIGNEAGGVCPELLNAGDAVVQIPMFGGAESLNAAIAASILMYEIKKQAMQSISHRRQA